MTQNTNYNEILSFVAEIGRLMLKYGAEVSTTKEIMASVAAHYGNEHCEALVLGNSIFTSEDPKAGQTRDKFLRIDLFRIKTPRLQYVTEITLLCSNIVEKNLSLEDARKELKRIRKIPPKPLWEYLLSAILICGSFCILYGGGWIDVLATSIAGILTKLYQLFIGKRFSVVLNTGSTAFVGTVICVILFHLGLGHTESRMVVSTISLLVPGVPLINGIRDIVRLDYLSGITQLVHVFLIFICMILGAIIALYCGNFILNGSPEFPVFNYCDTYSFVYTKYFAAFTTAIGFAMGFSVQRRFYLLIGLIAAIGYFIRTSLVMFINTFPQASIFQTADGYSDWIGMLPAAFLVYAISTNIAAYFKCPTVVFAVCAIILMNPSAKLFWTVFYFYQESPVLMFHNWYDSVISLINIIIGLVIAMEIPQRILKIRFVKVRHNDD